jgi:hypothetical protein
MTPQAVKNAQEAYFRSQILGSSFRRTSASCSSRDAEKIGYVLVVVERPVPDAPQASSFGGTHFRAWVDQFYALAAAGQHGDAIDLLYERVEAVLFEDVEKVDLLLAMLDPEQLSAEEVVAVLIATLAAKDRLPNRSDFLRRARPLLDREAEGADEVVRGLT